MSAPAVVATAMLQCSFGMAPSTLTVLPIRRVMVEGRPVAAIADIAPMVNVAPFGMCTSLANPSVASATAAALGVLTPMPCVPALAGPWKPGAATTQVGRPADADRRLHRTVRVRRRDHGRDARGDADSGRLAIPSDLGFDKSDDSHRLSSNYFARVLFSISRY